MEENSSTSLSAVSKSRLEFLFDGIFAIAMTILVLELRVPELNDRRSVGELARALGHHAPTFGSYLLSFGMLGIFWYRHNRQYRHFQAITHGMLVLHLVQLAAAAFFPFCAALLGRYPTNSLSIVVYAGCVLVYLWSMLVNWVIAKRCGVLGAEVTEPDYRRTRSRLLRGCLGLSTLFSLFLIKSFG